MIVELLATLSASLFAGATIYTNIRSLRNN